MACIVACALSSMGAGALLCLLPSAGAEVGIRLLTAIGLAGAFVLEAASIPDSTVFASDAQPSSTAANAHGTHLAALGAACAAVGIAAYAAFSAVFALVPEGSFPVLAALEVCGIALCCIACYLWARKAAYTALDERTDRYLQSAIARLPSRRNVPHFHFRDLGGADSPRKLAAFGIACAVAFALGAGTCLAAPWTTASVSSAVRIACPLLCLCTYAAYASALARLHKTICRAEEARRSEIDARLNRFAAEFAAAKASKAAGEAERALKYANEQAASHAAPNRLDAACTIAASRFSLTDREQQILPLLLAGHTRPLIGKELGLTLATINSHVQKIYHRMGVHSLKELRDALEELV